MLKELEPENVLAVGVDPSKDTLWVVGMKFPEVRLFSRPIENLPHEYEKLDATIQKLAEEIGLQVVYGLEDTGKYGKAFCDYLCARGRVVKEVNPIRTSRQKAFYGQDKSDEADAICIASIVLRSLHSLPDKKSQDGAWQALKELSSFRDTKVKQRTQLLNSLHNYLGKTYLSAYQHFFTNLNLKGALSFFKNYPRPQLLIGVSQEALAHFLDESSSRKMKTRKGGRTSLDAAKIKAEDILSRAAGVWDKPVDIEIEAVSAIIADITEQILFLNHSIAALEAHIGKLTTTLSPVLTSIRGIGTVRAGVLLAHTGDARRFRSRHAFAKYNGTSPCVKGSGKHVRHVKNRTCNRRLRIEFHQFAHYMSIHDPLSKYTTSKIH